jgi:hypothetical protein
MGYTSHRIWTLSGKAPSGNAEQLLDAWLLPGEPVQAALCGSVGLASTWFVATPLTTFMLRDGMQATIQSIPFNLIVGWQTHQSWSGDLKFDLNTSEGLFTLSQIKARYAVAFGQAIEGIAATIDEYGLPVDFQPLDFEISELTAAFAELLRDDRARRAINDAVPIAAVARDLARALDRSVGDARVVSFGHAILLWILALIAGLEPQLSHETRLQRVLALQKAIEEQPEYELVTAMHAAAGADSGHDWPTLMTTFAHTIDACAAWLSAALPGDVSEALRSEAGLLWTLGTSVPEGEEFTAGAPRPDADDILDRLERLQELRSAGAVTEDEFAQMKAKVLAAQL